MFVTVLTSRQSLRESLAVCRLAAETCTHPRLDPVPDLDDPLGSSAIVTAVRSGHLSVLEHCTVSVHVQGMSRAASHQLVRHRMASYSQQSLRYTTATADNLHWPEQEGMEDFGVVAMYAMDVYNRMIGQGVAREDAREVLPMATTSDLVMTADLREWMHILGLRMCARASAEMRDFAEQVASALTLMEPGLDPLLKPKCLHLGYCDEARGCGLMPSRYEVVESTLDDFGGEDVRDRPRGGTADRGVGDPGQRDGRINPLTVRTSRHRRCDREIRRQKMIDNSHYKGHKFEPIEVIADWDLDFDLGNVVKYISRAGRKKGTTEADDLEKALTYLQHAIARRKAKEGPSSGSNTVTTSNPDKGTSIHMTGGRP